MLLVSQWAASQLCVSVCRRGLLARVLINVNFGLLVLIDNCYDAQITLPWTVGVFSIVGSGFLAVYQLYIRGV